MESKEGYAFKSRESFSSLLERDIKDALDIIISEEKTSGSFKFLMGLLLHESGYLDIPMGSNETVMFREGSRAIGKRVFEMLYKISPEFPVHCLKLYEDRTALLQLALQHADSE